MILYKKTTDLQRFLGNERKKGSKIGFVPTMGALHPGHLSLIQQSNEQNDCTVCSIFVNPSQFNDPKDFDKYPVTIEKDIDLLEKAGCHVLFLPAVDEIYPIGIQSIKNYDLGFLETVLEGPNRKGHFQGVCMVVDRLLDIVLPRNLYLGQKDYQQCMVIKKLIEVIDARVNVIICPTLREDDGLAMSSRNMRLNEEERKKAVTIFQALHFIKANFEKGRLENLIVKAKEKLKEQGFKTDYVAIADADTLEILKIWDGKRKVVALAAAYLNEIRLIDNLVLN
jgi:pantoate--beta-alanine ligase